MKPSPDWTGVPDGVLAVMEALRFRAASWDRFGTLNQADWSRLLPWCDRRQVTLLLHSLGDDALPDWVGSRMAADRNRCAARFARLQRELSEIVEALQGRGIDFTLLKGISHAPALTPDPLLRAQGDLDLWFRRDDLDQARRTLGALGYVARRAGGNQRHLPPMVRPNDWKWRGDLFDPRMPIHVEPHYRLWCGDAEHIPLPPENGFWERRVLREFAGLRMPVLSPPDLIGFAAIHFLLHVLHGDLPLQRGWELARFLHNNASDDAFWDSWMRLHEPSLRRLEAVAFAVVRRWFACDAHNLALAEECELPSAVQRWLADFALSPLQQWRAPNKNELWLHMALIPSFEGKVRVWFRRLFPLSLRRKGGLNAIRLAHHLRTLTPSLLAGFRWMRGASQPRGAASTRRQRP